MVCDQDNDFTAVLQKAFILGTWTPHTGAPCTLRALTSSPVSRSLLTYVWIYLISRRKRCIRTSFLFSVWTVGRWLSSQPRMGQQDTPSSVARIRVCVSRARLLYWRTHFPSRQGLPRGWKYYERFLCTMCRNSLLLFSKSVLCFTFILLFLWVEKPQNETSKRGTIGLWRRMHGIGLFNICFAKII